ncbi:MAG: hypothetical protein AVDCRST_MAG38-774 [uncultured Solirubrobacteraceae bacterium]|uniref:LmbE family protein n=1 Tax=uncultured Solirubrobacteraceae bacterium TaxID=1162706 RepID=A0A6J4R7T4_9ACTN|nr:MAG: hypothetical protein AVDCRST_MAG38-774 [uncultured Solirubrobacteraceae bacterium]
MSEAIKGRVGTPLPLPRWGGRMAIVSPHLDDAVLSLGASTRAATRLGTSVDVLTIFSGDPTSTTPSDQHNRHAGFRTAGEAARARRVEDEKACRLVGARALWLPFADDANETPAADDEIVEALVERLDGYDSVLLPGFPLRHPDHRRVSRLALQALSPGAYVGLYVEQPYASWRVLSHMAITKQAPPAVDLEEIGLTVDPAGPWLASRCSPSDWAAKAAASGAYVSQMSVLRRAPRARILAYELLRGGERVLWCSIR